MKKEQIELIKREWPNPKRLEEEGYSNIKLPLSYLRSINQWIEQQTEYLTYYFSQYPDIREDFLLLMKVRQFVLDMKNMIGLALRARDTGEETGTFIFPTYFLIFPVAKPTERKTIQEFFEAGKEHKLELGEDKADRKLTEKEKKSRKKTPGKE